MAGSIDVYREPGAMSLCVTLLGVSRDWCPFATLLVLSVFLCAPGVSDSRYPITSARSGKRNQPDVSSERTSDWRHLPDRAATTGNRIYVLSNFVLLRRAKKFAEIGLTTRALEAVNFTA